MYSRILSSELFIQMCAYVFETRAAVRGLDLAVFAMF